MSFPTTLDDFTHHVDGQVIEPLDINELQDAIEALEAKVGINSSAVNTSHDYKLSTILTTDKAAPIAAAATLLNKILGSGTAITLGSDADYDIYYRLSGVLVRLPIVANRILKSTGGVLAWVAETTTVNASTTVAGIVELATAAEITAGTATGGTGAALAMTPDQLALSSPTFNGINLTNAPGILARSVTPQTTSILNTTENTLYTIAIPANTLGTVRALRVKLTGTFTGNSGVIGFTLRMKYGATVFSSIALVTSNNNGSWEWEGILSANAATNSQRGRSIFTMTPIISTIVTTGNIMAYVTDSQSLTEDSTTALNITITSQINSTSNAPSATVDNYLVEVV